MKMSEKSVFRGLMLGYQKRKWLRNHKKELKTAKNHAKDWLNKEDIILLWLGRVSKTKRILNGRPETFSKNRLEVFSQNGKVGISAIYFKGNFSHNIP